MPETTLLCKEFANPCPAASVLPSGTSIEGTGELKFTFGIFGTISCPESTVSTATSAETGNPLPGTMTSVTLVGCKGCTSIKFTNLPYKTSIEPTTGGNGKETVKFAEIEFSGCPLGTTCTYEGTMPLELKGGEFPSLIANQVEMPRLKGGGNCGEKLTINATWQSTTKNPIWVARMKA
jgi:hypothetical protein